MFDFERKLEEGARAQKIAAKHKAEIQHVYTELAKALGKFLKFQVTFYTKEEYEQDGTWALTYAVITNKLKSTGYKLVFLRNDTHDVDSPVLFKTIEPEDGYPVTIESDTHTFLSYSQDELANTLSNIISDVKFHADLASFKKKYEDKLKKETQK
ncbi:hypothetical protein O1D86_000376 [Vibrio cholerae]|nr:hypothetical protein [Vibrio cholerae]